MKLKKWVGVLFVTQFFHFVPCAPSEPNAREILEQIYSRAKDAYAQRDFGTAVENFRLLKTYIPEWKDNHYNLATSLLFMANVGDAFEALDDAVKLFPNDPEVYSKYCSMIASMLNQPNDFINVEKHKTVREMVDTCVKAVSLQPESSEIYRVLASLLTLVKEYKAAISVFDDWIRRFGDRDLADTHGTKNSLAESLVRNGEYERAFQIAKELYDESPSALHTQKVAYVRKIGWPIDHMAWQFQKESVEMIVKGFRFSNSAVCDNSKAWRVAYNFSEEALRHPERVSVTLLNPLSAYKTYGREDDPTFVGRTLPVYPRLYHERYIYLVHLKNAFMSGHPGIIHGDCTLYTGSHHVNTDLQTFPERDVDIVEIKDRAVTIIQHQIRNYYHWMLEALPKLLILKELLLDKPEYADVKIMVPEKGIAGCIDSTLSMSEFDSIRDRFILYKYPGSTRYHFKKGLHLVDWMHAQDDVHETLSKNLWSAYWPPREIHHNLRAFFYKALMARNKMPVVHVDDTDGAIVYVSRINSVRGFPNELELLDYLKGRFGDRFQIHTGQEAQLDQVAMFARARVVVGTHGAGLANYVFAQPGAALVFVPMDPLIEFCFGHIVAAMGGSHYLITEIPGSHYHGTYGKITEEQMQLMGDTIQIALDKILAQTLSHHDEL